MVPAEGGQGRGGEYVSGGGILLEVAEMASDDQPYGTFPCNRRRPDQFPSTDTLIHLTELILTLNNFSFNSSHFLQTKGVAM
eukprot:g13736.t1